MASRKTSEFVGSIFWPSPSFEDEITKLAIVKGNSQVGANCQCEKRAIAVCRQLQPPSLPPMLRRRLTIAPTSYFPIVHNLA